MRAFLCVCVCVLCLLFCFLVHCLQVGQPNMPPATHLPWKEKNHHPSGIPSLRPTAKAHVMTAKPLDLTEFWLEFAEFRLCSSADSTSSAFCRASSKGPEQISVAMTRAPASWHSLQENNHPQKKRLHGIQCFQFFAAFSNFKVRKGQGKCGTRGRGWMRKSHCFFPTVFSLPYP